MARNYLQLFSRHATLTTRVMTTNKSRQLLEFDPIELKLKQPTEPTEPTVFTLRELAEKRLPKRWFAIRHAARFRTHHRSSQTLDVSG